MRYANDLETKRSDVPSFVYSIVPTAAEADILNPFFRMEHLRPKLGNTLPCREINKIDRDGKKALTCESVA